MSGTTDDKKPAPPSKAEEAIAKGMEAIRIAVRLAPRHDDLFAACEALMRHLTDTHRPPTDAERNHMSEGAWADLSVEAKVASEERFKALAESYKALPAAARADVSEYQWAEMTDAERAPLMAVPTPPSPPAPTPSPPTPDAPAPAPRPTTKAS